MTEPGRETFRTRFGMLMSMIGVAVGLGNVWRFPYMVGRYGGATFVLVYIAAVVLIGIPALMAEWALGRTTRRGTAGAFRLAGLPFGRAVGWLLFGVTVGAMGYYTNALGWVLYHALAQIARPFGEIDASRILPPASGFDATSFGLQLACTGAIVFGCALVVRRGVRAGIERASSWIMPALACLLVLMTIRTLTLPGTGEGVAWYLLQFDLGALNGGMIVAAIGQAVFSMSLGGTFMVVYGSYLPESERLGPGATWTAAGDLIAGLLAGLAIIPAVIAFGLEPGSGPGLLFATLPELFGLMPLGALLGAVFFTGLFGAAYLSDVAAFEVLVAGVTDNSRIGRKQAVPLVAGAVFAAAIPPMINLEIFVPWDLTFGSGMQTVGALLAVIAVAWCLDRASALKELDPDDTLLGKALIYWLRFVVPGALLLIGIWWVLTELLGAVAV